MNLRKTLLVSITGMVCLLSNLSSFAQTDKALDKAPINVASNIDTLVVAEPLDSMVNSMFIEYGPTLTKDGRRLYFSRQGHAKNTGGTTDEDIWYSEFIDSLQSWDRAINIGAPLNNAGPNFISGVGVNGDTLLLGNEYEKNGTMREGLSISVRVGNTWSFPRPVNIRKDINLSKRTSFDLSNDRKALLIAQAKSDSYGGLDLCVSFRRTNDKNHYSAKESINLGPVINSTGDETSPFLAYDNRTLYFSSNSHSGYGKQDIFVSTRLDSTWTKWSKPLNLGSGINTEFDDEFFGFTPRSRYAYYSRGITGTNLDIYRLDMTYLFKPSAKPLNQLDSLIGTAQIGQSIVLDSMFLDNNDQIRATAWGRLQVIAQYMNEFQGYTILVSTHSNRHETRKESQALSERRVTTIIDYLVSKGIKRERLETQGYGHDVVANMDNLPTLPGMKARVASSVEFRLVAFTKYVHAEFR